MDNVNHETTRRRAGQVLVETTNGQDGSVSVVFYLARSGSLDALIARMVQVLSDAGLSIA